MTAGLCVSQWQCSAAPRLAPGLCHIRSNARGRESIGDTKHCRASNVRDEQTQPVQLPHPLQSALCSWYGRGRRHKSLSHQRQGFAWLFETAWRLLPAHVYPLSRESWAMEGVDLVLFDMPAKYLHMPPRNKRQVSCMVSARAASWSLVESRYSGDSRLQTPEIRLQKLQGHSIACASVTKECLRIACGHGVLDVSGPLTGLCIDRGEIHACPVRQRSRNP